MTIDQCIRSTRNRLDALRKRQDLEAQAGGPRAGDHQPLSGRAGPPPSGPATTGHAPPPTRRTPSRERSHGGGESCLTTQPNWSGQSPGRGGGGHPPAGASTTLTGGGLRSWPGPPKLPQLAEPYRESGDLLGLAMAMASSKGHHPKLIARLTVGGDPPTAPPRQPPGPFRQPGWAASQGVAGCRRGLKAGARPEPVCQRAT